MSANTINERHTLPNPLDFVEQPGLWWSKVSLYGGESTDLPAPLSDAAAFKPLAEEVARQALACSNDNRFNDVARLQILLEWAEPFCKQEPMASAYDHCLANIGLLTAYGALSRLQHEQVYEQVELLYELLKEGRARRSANGIQSDQSHEMRLRCLSLLAEAKWLDSPQARDRTLTPRRIVDEYRSLGASLEDYLAALEYDEAELPLVLQDHAWSGLAILKVALRYLEPTEWEDILLLFNSAHNTELDLMLAQETISLRGVGVELLWRLEWEIAKLASLGPLDHELLTEIQALRIATASESQLGENYIQSSEREYAAISKVSWRQSLWSLAENGKLIIGSY